MGGGHRIEKVPVEIYFATERESPARHEYVDGLLFAMTGAT